MKLSHVVYKIVLVTLVLVFLPVYVSGCGSGSNSSNNNGNTSNPTDPNPTSNDVISYANDIQPIFNANCTASSCHGANAPSGLKLIAYASFAKGGVSGSPFVAGDFTKSLIIKRLEGTIPPMMPKGGAPLSNTQIQKIKDWITAGAKDN